MIVISWVMLLLGSAFCLIGTLGLMRLPDFYSRVHAASIIDSMGTILVLLGLLVQTQDILVIAKLILILLFMMLTGPTAVHALAHTASLKEKDSEPDSASQLS
ncbi:MAG: monovalent cation/H(+) antiporter subunit G [Gammaproteobacteria bacterium]|nr:monovalent cation/H(+) antiporter subunit G [Gammaproteobacteria bacterium]MDE0412366.1 monovalent cation/H(+) antiporter subunit G [Gammaproteobacteria bacterium]